MDLFLVHTDLANDPKFENFDDPKFDRGGARSTGRPISPNRSPIFKFWYFEIPKILNLSEHEPTPDHNLPHGRGASYGAQRGKGLGHL